MPGLSRDDRPSLDDFHRALLLLVSMAAELFVGEPSFPEIPDRDTFAAFPFGLRNAVQDMWRLITQRMASKPADTEPIDTTDTEFGDTTKTEFIGMADYVSESIHDLADPSESLSVSGSCDVSHHLSHECFMADSRNDRVALSLCEQKI